MLQPRLLPSIKNPTIPKKKKEIPLIVNVACSYNIYDMFEKGEIPPYAKRKFDADNKDNKYTPFVSLEAYPDCCGMKIIHGMRRYEFEVFEKDLPILIQNAKKSFCGVILCVCSLDDQQAHIALLIKSGFVHLTSSTNPLHGHNSSFGVYSLTLGKKVTA